MTLFLNLLLIAWFITQFEPLQDLIQGTLAKLADKFTSKVGEYIIGSIMVGAGCFKCVSFWLVLGVTFDFYFSVYAAIIGQVYQNLILNEK
jgi:hypothetical protein